MKIAFSALWGALIECRKMMTFKKLLISTAITLLSMSHASAYEVNKTSCANVESHIVSTKADMREGYTQAKGERLRAKLQLLKEQRRACKRKKFATA